MCCEEIRTNCPEGRMKVVGMKVDVSRMAYEDVASVMNGVAEGVEGFFREGEKVFVEISVARLNVLPAV